MKFWGESNSMLETSLALAKIARVSASDIQGRAYLAVGLLSLFLAALLAGVALTVGALISRGLTAIHEGARALARGKLDYEVEVRSRDEIGELAEGFNLMTEQLRRSRGALEQEVLEHQRTAESLRESNQQLSDALIKLQRAQQQVIVQQRMEALEQIARGLIHDFNGSLTPILSSCEYLLMDRSLLSDPNEVADAITLINEAALAQKRLVRNLGEFFCPGDLARTDRISINAAVKDAVEMTRPGWKEQSKARGVSLEVVTDLANDIPDINGNAVELREAITNLILNSVDAMPAGGEIRVTTRRDGGAVVIQVHDNGEGMMPDVKERCFEPFFSTKGQNASGMGLPTIRGVIARHQGTVELQSEPGQGTEVTIRLPILRAVTLDVPKAPTIGRLPSGLHVLVVDDETWARSVVEKYLRNDGCQVVPCSNGESGLAAARTGQFDVVILDRALPDFSGDQVAAGIRELAAKTPIVMLTGFGSLMQKTGEKPADVDVLVSKPFSWSELRAAIVRAIQIHA